MSTYNAFYVRKQAADDVTRAAIVSLYPKARIETSADFVGAVLTRGDSEPAEQRLLELSAKLGTDVIGRSCLRIMSYAPNQSAAASRRYPLQLRRHRSVTVVVVREISNGQVQM